MRASEYLILVVFIGIFAFLVISGGNEMNDIYTDNQINTSSMGKYQSFDNINKQVNSSIENFKTLGDEDASWFQKLGAGIVAIPKAVIQFPIMVIVATTTLVSYMGDALGGILPATIVLALGTLLMIEVVRRFMEFFQKSRA